MKSIKFKLNLLLFVSKTQRKKKIYNDSDMDFVGLEKISIRYLFIKKRDQ